MRLNIRSRVSHFGQSADLPDLYAAHGLDADAIVAAALDIATP